MQKENLSQKRDVLFLVLSGIFLTSLILGNVIGTTKFVSVLSFEMPDWLLAITPKLVLSGNIYSMSVPVGVLAYPFTFLATDLIAELFGRKKAQLLVLVGFGLNFFMLFLMMLGNFLPDASGISGGKSLFDGVYEFMIANTLASMTAYLIAQSVDVQLFHFWKKITKGKHLWLRNNGSTMVSQMLDSITILTILFFAGNLGASVVTFVDLGILIINSYLFKFVFALLDTPLFYLGVRALKNYNEDVIG